MHQLFLPRPSQNRNSRYEYWAGETQEKTTRGGSLYLDIFTVGPAAVRSTARCGLQRSGAGGPQGLEWDCRGASDGAETGGRRGL